MTSKRYGYVVAELEGAIRLEGDPRWYFLSCETVPHNITVEVGDTVWIDTDRRLNITHVVKVRP